MSTRRPSQDGPNQIPPIIVRDVPDEALQPQTKDPTTARTTAHPPAVLPSRLPTRTRKAKEMQKRLGVGRPVAAGGSGPRVVTRSATISREKRVRGSESMKQLEATTQEGNWLCYCLSSPSKMLNIPKNQKQSINHILSKPAHLVNLNSGHPKLRSAS